MQLYGLVCSVLRGFSSSRFPLLNGGIGLLLLVASATAASAQDLPDVAQGLQPYTAYHGGDLDQISTLNGGLTLKIPLISYPQNGALSLSFSIEANSFSYRNVHECQAALPGGPGFPNGSGGQCTDTVQLIPTGLAGTNGIPQTPHLVIDQTLYGAGISVTPDPTSPQNIDGRYYVVTSDNAQHPLTVTANGQARSIDGSGYLFLTNTSNYPIGMGATDGDSQYTEHLVSGVTGTVVDRKGIAYGQTGMTDLSGNTIIYNYNSTGNLQDSTGRIIPPPPPIQGASSGSTAGCPTIDTTGTQPLTSSIAWQVPGTGGVVTYLFCYATVSVATNINGGYQYRGTLSSDLFTTMVVLQSIVLPHDSSTAGQYWGFLYDSANFSAQTYGTGNLTKIIYPTGGTIAYTYASAGSGACDPSRQQYLGTGVTMTTWPLGVATRVTNDGQGNIATWSYAGNQILGPPQQSSSSATPTQSLTQISYTQDPTPHVSGCGIQVEAGRTTYAGSTTGTQVLKSVATQFTWYAGDNHQPYAGASYPQTVTTTLDDGSTTSTSYQYLSGLPAELVTDEKVTGYNTSAVLREKTTSYLWSQNSNYLNLNLIDLPSQTRTLDSNQNVVEQKTYAYDESSSARGLVTTVTDGIPGGLQAVTRFGWNATGEKSFTIDPDANAGDSTHLNPSTGHTIDYSYGQCGGSVLTSTTNALQQTVSATYFCPSGQIQTYTDANNNTSTFQWDGLRRIMKYVGPAVQYGNPETDFAYNDPANQVTETIYATPNPNRTLTETFDGFGRVIHSSASDPISPILVDTTYDLLGRTHTVSNPHRSTSDSTYGITSTWYDPLARKTQVIDSDSTNSTLLQYTGPLIDSLDENQTHLQHTKDALGRLVKVMELGNSADPRSLETDYTYDALDNLKSVNQHGISGETPRTRSFTYDSLARLITSQNPETGTICYGTWNSGSCQNGYDANGNLRSKTDANGVTMSYNYDPLNRLSSKVATDGSVNDTYIYDVTAQGPNEIGRLSASTTGVAASGSYYDAMGRTVGVSYFDPHVGWRAGNSANYDLAGNPTVIAYSDGRAISQVYDSAGRLTTVTDTTSGGPGTVYFSSAQYIAAGALASATYGNGATESITYNNRLQPCRTLAISPALLPIESTGNVYDRVSSYANNPLNSAPCNPEPGNNGNIAYIADSRNVNWTQSFAYDGLNRLTSASRSDGGYNHTYNYDSFGNLIVQDNINPSPTYSINAATNQLNRFANNVNIYNYDAAGNLLSSGTSDIGGHSYTYNALSQILTVDGGTTASYTYNALDQRSLKQTSTGWTEYVYLDGQPMEEQTQDGTWTDYIYANGQKIAKVTSSETRLHSQGNFANSDEAAGWPLSGPIIGYVIQPHDRLMWKQYQSGTAHAGLAVGVNTPSGWAWLNWVVLDTDGQSINSDGYENVWHNRTVDLSAYAGSNVGIANLETDANTGAGAWNVWYKDLVLVSGNGTVMPIYTGQRSFSVPTVQTTDSNPAAQTLVVETATTTPGGSALSPSDTANYYLDDHLGTTQVEMASGGWPLWQGQFTPFGAELDNGLTNMHYKFTGKERDAESGLDDFGARYYASTTGRWMSPDWAEKPEAVPYSTLANPQSLNLYAYGGNNPLRQADLDGHCLRGENGCLSGPDDPNGDPYFAREAAAWSTIETGYVATTTDPQKSDQQQNGNAKDGDGKCPVDACVSAKDKIDKGIIKFNSLLPNPFNLITLLVKNYENKKLLKEFKQLNDAALQLWERTLGTGDWRGLQNSLDNFAWSYNQIILMGGTVAADAVALANSLIERTPANIGSGTGAEKAIGVGISKSEDQIKEILQKQ